MARGKQTDFDVMAKVGGIRDKRIQEKQIEIYLSTGELMDMLSISRSTVNRPVKRRMPHIWVGSTGRFPLQEIIQWLKNDQQKN